MKFTILLIQVMVILLVLFSSSCNKQTENEKNNISPEGIATQDDPFARIEYEKMKLVDPATGEIPQNIRSRELNFAKTYQSEFHGKKGPANWQSRGPFNVGGRTRAFAFDVNDENTILAGGVTGGMWRSTNGGASFIKTTTADQFQSVTCVSQDTRSGKTDVWYYGTGEYYAVISAAAFSNQASGNGIFKSNDGGQSWQLLQSTVSNTPTTLYENRDFDFVWNIITDPTDTVNDVVYAAVINGIYKSLNGGQTWSPTLGLDSNATNLSRFTDVIITSSGILYATLNSAGSNGGIWRSVDGDNWVNIIPTGWPNTYRRTVMAVAPSDENQVYFLSQTPNSGVLDHNLWHYTYVSGDGSDTGGIWDNRTSNLPDYKCEVFYDFTFGSYNSQRSYDMCIAVKPDDPDIVVIGGTDVFRSTDGFASQINHAWIGGYQCDTSNPSNYIYTNHHPDIHQLKFLPSNSDVLFTGSDGGVHKTIDFLAADVQWQSLNNGYVTSQFYTVSIEHGPVSNDFIVGGMQDNGTYLTNSPDPNTDWSHVFYGDGAYAAISNNRENYYLSWQTGKVFKFEIDDNGTVIAKTRIDPLGGAGHLFIAPFILDPQEDNRMYMAAGRYIWRNNALDSIPMIDDEYNPISDGWEILNESSTGFGSNISTLAIPPSNNNKVFYGTTTGLMYRIDSLINGNRVRTTLTGSFPFNSYLSCVSVNESNEDEVMISFSNYLIPSIFHSLDGGNTWSDISGTLEENPDGSGDGPSVMWVEMLNLGDSTIYFAGTSIGLFTSTSPDSLNTIWNMEGQGTLGNSIINMIKTRSNDGLVALATHGNGIYSARYKTITSIEPIAEIEFALKQNYPNPFSGSTTIEYNLSAASKVSLAVYSQNGNKIKSLVDEVQSSGKYRSSWDATDLSGQALPAGIYFVRLMVEDEVFTRKALLLF